MKKFEKTEMTTLVSCTNKLTTEGYTENFVAKENGIEAQSSKKMYEPYHVKVNSFYRFEGESDPADNSILYAIETNDGLKGMLVDAYGVYANPLVSDFMLQVEEIEKKAHVHRNPVNKFRENIKKLYGTAQKMLAGESAAKVVVAGLLIAAGIVFLMRLGAPAKPKSLLQGIHLN